MVYGHVTNGTVDQIGMPPEKWFDGTRWWDLRTLDANTLKIAGWYLVTETARPADTASVKYVPAYTFNGSSIVQSWTQVAKTPEEIAADTATTNYAELIAKIPAALANNQTAITNLQTAIQALNTIAGQSWANQTQRDNALKNNATHTATIGQHAIALTRQNNVLMRIIGDFLSDTSGT
jgi:hypothetical protein